MLARICACSFGAVVALAVGDAIEREVRFRAVMQTFTSTREVVPNVSGRSFTGIAQSDSLPNEED
jgi:hypothetical protein